MSRIGMTVEEFADTITGFEEIAIEKLLDFDFYEIAEAGKNVKLLRALVFVATTREGVPGPEAKAAAFNLPAGELPGYFDDPEPEVDDDAPETESGKDDTPPE